jgi:methyl-accepting chemotaxis protein
MQTLADEVNAATSPAERAAVLLDKIRNLAAESESQVQAITSMTRAHADTTNEMSGSVKSILEGMERSEQEVPIAANAILTLAQTAENIFAAVAPHCDDGVHHTMRELAQTAAKRVSELFEASIATGKITLEDLFDRNHRQIPNTSPPKIRRASMHSPIAYCRTFKNRCCVCMRILRTPVRWTIAAISRRTT